MKTKRKGTRIEAKVIELFEAVGLRCIRSAGSHGPFDVVGFLGPLTMLVQVKSNKKPSAEEIEEMRSWNVSCDKIKTYCVWKDREKYPVFYFEQDW